MRNSPAPSAPDQTATPPSANRWVNSLWLQALAVWIITLLILGGTYQVRSTFTVEVGQTADDGAVWRGFGDRESNQNFSFRWTNAPEAVVKLPDVGWPSRVRLVGVSPLAPSVGTPVTLTVGAASTAFNFSPTNASAPPDLFGRLSFEAVGPVPHFSLTSDELKIVSPLTQPPGDNRSLGIVVSRIEVAPQASRLGLTLPPLTAWLGWSLLVTIGYINLTITFKRKSPAKIVWPVVAVVVGIIVIASLRLVYPGWMYVNSAGVAWGLLVPLGLHARLFRCGWLFAHASLALLAIGTLAVFAGVVTAGLALSLFFSTAALLLVGAWRSDFANSWQNIGILTGLSAGAGWALWQGVLPRSDDISRYHLYWVNELDRLIKLGNFYPRWSPDFSWQQGSPIFNFYPPLGRYLTEAFHLLGYNFSSAIMLIQFSGLIFGTIGCYFWCYELLGIRRAAMLGAVAFCYYPFRLADIYSVGTLANYLAGVFLPWAFWQLTRVVRQPSRPWAVIWLAGAGAGIALSNTIQLFIFVPLAALYIIGLLLVEWHAGRLNLWHSVGRLAGAAVIAVGLCAFFLLPATFEGSQIALNKSQVRANVESDGGFRFFALWPDSLALWQAISPNLQDYTLFGTLHFVLAGLGLGVLMVRRTVSRASLLVLLALTSGLLFLVFPISNFFWSTFPFFTLIQFTARLMYSTIVFAAPLIAGLALVDWPHITAKGVGPRAKPGYLRYWFSGLISMVVVSLMIYGCFQNIRIAYWPTAFQGDISQKALTEQIINGDEMYVPASLKNLNVVSKYSSPAFADNRLPPSADQLQWQISGPNLYTLTVNSSRAGTVSVPLFWYEGWWQVTDESGREYPTKLAGDGTAHVSFEVTAGRHSLTLRTHDRPIVTASLIVTLLTLLGLLVYVLWLRFRRVNK